MSAIKMHIELQVNSNAYLSKVLHQCTSGGGKMPKKSAGSSCHHFDRQQEAD